MKWKMRLNRLAGPQARRDLRPGTRLALAILLAILVELCSRRSFLSLIRFIFTNPYMFFYNVMIIFWTLSLVVLFRRRYLAGLCISVFWLILGVTDLVLLSCRVTPFNAADLRLTKDAITIAGKYLAWWHVVLLAVGVILLITGFVIGFIRLPKSTLRFPIYKSVPLIAAALLTLVGCDRTVTSFGLLQTNFGNLAQAYQSYGFPYCFSISVVRTGVKKPDTYDEEVVENIAQEEILPEEYKEGTRLLEIDEQMVDATGIAVTQETPNIIFLQLESFWDVTEMLGTTCDMDPIPVFRELSEQYTSGYLSVPAVGAGTANTEFEVMTGMNLDFFGPGEYPYKTVLQDESCESLAFDLKDIGYHAHAIHNNSGTFYDRYQVFSQLGYDTFTSLEYMSGYDRTPMGWATDDILTKEIAAALSSTVGADYIYTISVQGHGSYPTEEMIEDNPFSITGDITDEEAKQMEYYLYQINQMDHFVKNLVSYLEMRGEPTVLVMYGDHLPSFDVGWEQLLSRSEFRTKYVIWDNLGLKQMAKNLEAYQLGAYVLQRLGINYGTMFRFHQSYQMDILSGTTDEERYLNDMQVLEYDILYGDRNVYELEGETPYQPSNLHMGVETIRIDNVFEEGGGMYVTGWHFTPNSVIMIDDEKCETMFVSTNMLYTQDLDTETESSAVCVAQVSDDNIILSQTDRYQSH